MFWGLWLMQWSFCQMKLGIPISWPQLKPRGSWRSANNWDILESMFISSHQQLSFDFVSWTIHRFSQSQKIIKALVGGDIWRPHSPACCLEMVYHQDYSIMHWCIFYNFWDRRNRRILEACIFYLFTNIFIILLSYSSVTLRNRGSRLFTVCLLSSIGF